MIARDSTRSMLMALVCFSTGEIESLLSRADDLQLSRRARERLSWLQYHALTGSVTGTCRRYQIPRITLYRLLRRFDPREPSTLEDRSRRPHTVRDTPSTGFSAPVAGNAPVLVRSLPSAEEPGLRGRCLLCRLLAGDRCAVRRTLLVSVVANVLLAGILVLSTRMIAQRATPTRASLIHETPVAPVTP